VTVALWVKLTFWAHENEANDTVDFWLLREQIWAVQKAYDDVVPQLTLQTLSWVMRKYKNI
jgi:hypothetical protein